MSKNLRRLLIATAISATGFFGTQLWEKLTAENSGIQNSGAIVADLKSAVHDVERKPTRRLIWQAISAGEELHAGETIRTASDAEASVVFRSSNTRIDLDPDSEIVIEEVNGKLELNFHKGNLTVASADGSVPGGDELTLNAGDKKIALGGSELSLSSDSKGKVDVQVIKGNADLSSKTSIQVVSPKLGDLVYVNLKEKELVAVEFKALPPGYKLILEAGKKREELKPVEISNAAAESGKLQAALKPGRLFWRLVAKPLEVGKPDLVSPLMKLSVLAKSPVVLLEPAKDETLSLDEITEGVEMSWSNPAQLENLKLEVFKTRDYSKPVLSESLDPVATAFTAKLREPGNYSWRVSGTLKGKTEMVVGQLREFGLIEHKELASPLPTAPKDDDTIPFQAFTEQGLDLKWKPVEGAVSYKVRVVNRKTNDASEFEAASPLLKVRSLKPGDYSWTVNAVGSKNQASKPSNAFTFNLQELLELKWADGKTEDDHRYATSSPSLDLAWEKGPEAAVKWRVRLTAERDLASDAAWSLVGTTNISKAVPSDGTYVAEVEALDGKGRVLARAIKRKIAVAQLPLLDPPLLLPAEEKELKAENNGSIHLSWQAVPGATEYVLKYSGKGPRSATETRLKETESSLKHLLPGRYTVSLRSIDQYGRQGPVGEARAILVPNTSDVRAPKMKKVQVK